MNANANSFSINVDVTNPGQFFACCGLLELAHRLWPGAEGYFTDKAFCVQYNANVGVSLPDLLDALAEATLEIADPDADKKTAPLYLGGKFSLRLDWWREDGIGVDRLKTWAGQQSVFGIATAMKSAISSDGSPDGDLLNLSQIVIEPGTANKTVEPFYFDARRFAQPIDAGFSLDVQGLSTVAHPAVEFLCLVGLQRFRPATTDSKWQFAYSPWRNPLPASVAKAAVCGAFGDPCTHTFTLRFRDGQHRYKAFDFSVPGDQQ